MTVFIDPAIRTACFAMLPAWLLSGICTRYEASRCSICPLAFCCMTCFVHIGTGSVVCSLSSLLDLVLYTS